MNSELVKEFLLESFENLSSISDELTKYEKKTKNLRSSPTYKIMHLSTTFLLLKIHYYIGFSLL